MQCVQLSRPCRQAFPDGTVTSDVLIVSCTAASSVALRGVPAAREVLGSLALRTSKLGRNRVEATDQCQGAVMRGTSLMPGLRPKRTD